MSVDGFCLLYTEQLSVESVFSSLCHWQIAQKLVRNTVNTIRINLSENKQQPCASRSGSSKWEKAKLGSTVEKLQNSHSFPFPLKTSLNTYLRFSKYLELDNSSGLHENEVYILYVHILMYLVRNVLRNITIVHFGLSTDQIFETLQTKTLLNMLPIPFLCTLLPIL